MNARATLATAKVEKQRRVASIAFRLSLIAAVLGSLAPWRSAQAQAPFRTSPAQARPAEANQNADAEAELQAGIALTRQGKFREAIPHFLGAQGQVANEFALDFDLALCYVATDQFKKAIPILSSLHGSEHAGAEVFNLLAQAYLGNDQPQEAFGAFKTAANLSPQNEKLYLFVADACMDHQYYTLGLEVVKLGLQHLPRSSRLYYERGVLHSLMDQPDLAKDALAQASQLAPGSNISYLAASQKRMLDGNIPAAIQAARDGIQSDPENYVLLTILGQALIRSGAGPGQPEFAEAEAALERAVTVRPNFAASQLALGQLYRMGGRLDAAIAHLEIARQLAPGNTSAYSNLAMAYQRQGKNEEARKMLAILDSLNRARAAKYKSGSPDQKASYTGAALKE
jgi:tetratricopeptide (TPR) repeat protein